MYLYCLNQGLLSYDDVVTATEYILREIFQQDFNQELYCKLSHYGKNRVDFFAFLSDIDVGHLHLQRDTRNKLVQFIQYIDYLLSSRDSYRFDGLTDWLSIKYLGYS